MIKALLLVAMILASSSALTGAYAEEGKVKTVTIVLGSSNKDSGVFYHPASLKVETGTTVRWTNEDRDPHTVTDGTPDSQWGKIFDSGLMKENFIFEHKFTEPGTYPYLCAMHPWMFGKVIVEEPVQSEQSAEDQKPAVSVETGKVKITEKINVFIRSDRQTFGQDEEAKLGVDILVGNKPVDPDIVEASVIATKGFIEDQKPIPVSVTKIDAGRYSVTLDRLKPATYNLSVKASKEGFESGSSLLTVRITKTIVSSLPTILLEADQDKYTTGDTITIHGKVLNPVKDNTAVVLRVFDPTAKLYTRGQAEIGTDGTFEWTFKVAGGASGGNWNLRADYMEYSSEFSLNIEKIVVTPAEPAPKGAEPPADKHRNEKVSIMRSLVTDQMRSELSSVHKGQQVTIQSEITNNREINQKFVYILQVKDSHGIVVKLDMAESVLPAGKSFNLGIAWMPDSKGRFLAEVFVWKSLDEPVPLSLDTQKIRIVVTD